MDLNLPTLAVHLGLLVSWQTSHGRSCAIVQSCLLGKLCCALMFVHFELLGAHTGALIMFVAGVQAALAIPLGHSPRFKLIYLGSLLLTPLVCFLSWQGAQSIFSSLALVIVSVANFQLNQVHQRALLITAIFAWVAHNIIVGSTPGLVSNVLAFCVSAVMFRACRAPKMAAI